MSKSTLKLKHFEILNLSSYFQELNDDILHEEEEIVDVIYETSDESKFIFTFLFLLSRGSLLYIEYNTTIKKLTKIFKNSVLCSIITNEIICCELSYNSPIILATSLNELILIDTKCKPCQIINITEENIVIHSAYCESSILDIKFNCNQSTILLTTTNQLLIYKMDFDKFENKPILKLFDEIKLVGVNVETIDYGAMLNKRYFPNFSDFSENILYISYFTDEKIGDYYSEVLLENDEPTGTFFFNIVQITLGKKDYVMRLVKTFKLEKSIIKICFTYFNEKLFFLYKDGIICCVNALLVKDNADDIYDNKLVFKYPLSTSVKFCDIFFHPSSNFIVVKDTQNDYLIFDFTLNLYYIMHNSKITVKLNLNSFDKSEIVRQVKLKPYDIYYSVKNRTMELNKKNVPKNNSIGTTSPNMNLNEINDFKIDKNIQKIIYSGKLNNNSMFFFDSSNLNGIFIEISATFNQTTTLNPLLDEFQLLKNHLRGQNFDSSFKILRLIQNFNLWLQALLLIIYKLCHSPYNILLLKKHSLDDALKYLKEKTFNDETKKTTVNNIKTVCFTNLLYRCLAIRQYEYAFLIAEKINQPYLFKMIVSHTKLNKFYGISYLACNKLEPENTNGENDESIITDINKIISSSNFTLSQSNMQQMVKDVDQLLENNNLNNDYMRENNSLEINLERYMEALKLEMEGKFEEAKEIYKQNNLNYDYMRVEKLNRELINQINEDCIIEFNDI